MFPDDLFIAQVMVLMDKAVVERFKRGMAYQRDLGGRKIRKYPADGAFIYGNNLDVSVSSIILAIMHSGREFEISHAFQSDEYFAAGHVFGGAVGLEPCPVVAQDLGDALPSFVPVFINHPLNHGDVSIRDGSSANGDG